MNVIISISKTTLKALKKQNSAKNAENFHASVGQNVQEAILLWNFGRDKNEQEHMGKGSCKRKVNKWQFFCLVPFYDA